MIKKFTLSLFSFISIFAFIQDLSAQSWDYKAYPVLPFEISHLDAELNIKDTGSIEGDILYLIKLKDENLDSLVLDSRDIEILSAVINNETKEFYIENHKLVVLTDGEYERGDEISLRIQYRTTPDFGLYQTAKGTFFTSFLPLTTSHWLPVPDHPRVEFTSEFIFTHPAGKSVVSNGRRASMEIESVSEETTSFTSNKTLSPVDINFAMGDLDLISSTQNGFDFQSEYTSMFERRSDHQIHIYTENSDLQTDQLLQSAVDAYGKLYENLNIGYPFRDLSIIVLDDNFWETKSYGAGIIYLYVNRGDLEAQLKRAMTGVWLGAHFRAEQWSDPDAITALQGWTHNSLFDLDYVTVKTDEPYHVFDGSLSSKWQYNFAEGHHEKFNGHFERVYNFLLSESSRVLSWTDLAEEMYEDSGIPYFDKPELDEITREETSDQVYMAEMSWGEDRQNITVSFDAVADPVNELVTVRVKEYTLLDEKENEITFTGESDSVVLNVSGNTENIVLSISGRDDIRLEVQKPFEFWMHQLRNAEDSERRKEAAVGLAGFSDNPDVQLVLQDQMRNEDNPEVYAELLRTFSAVTKGATGTDQTLIDQLSTGNSEEVRLAAVEGLAYFRGNDSVISRLRSIANQTDNSDIRTAAVRSLNEVTDSERFKIISEDLITQESLLQDVPLILNLLSEKGEKEAAVQYAGTFITDGFPYSIRSKVLDMILETDQSREGWENRLPSLLEDRDPRIRIQSLNAMDRVSSSFRNEWLDRRMTEEYDERVRRALSQF
ncbi:HEAT repeat domain-containing protein [Rhodohalobacter sp.]|uniref:HEAT repeat domain-containing protein n=1 Tax=Rhodohalobacter sp. TaxID=1974210 RepID=UPI003562761E